MSKVIIIRGPLGIGKSTISKELAKILNGVYISIDEVLSKNDLDKMPEGENIPVSHFIKANELIIEEIKNNLKKNISVIVDGNFYYKEALEHLVNLFKKI